MAGFRATVVFLLGTLAGLGAALLLFVAHLVDPMRPLLFLRSANAFLVAIWCITGGVLGSVAVYRCGKSLRLRTMLCAVAVIAVLLWLTIEVGRRSREYWALSVQHRLKATAAAARLRKDRLDPRVPRTQLAQLQKHATWNRDVGIVYSRAAYVPWLPLPDVVPCGCRLCTAPTGERGDDE